MIIDDELGFNTPFLDRIALNLSKKYELYLVNSIELAELQLNTLKPSMINNFVLDPLIKSEETGQPTKIMKTTSSNFQTLIEYNKDAKIILLSNVADLTKYEIMFEKINQFKGTVKKGADTEGITKQILQKFDGK